MNDFNPRTDDSILREKEEAFRLGNYVEVGPDHPDIVFLSYLVALLRNETVPVEVQQDFASLPFTDYERRKSICASLTIAFSLTIEDHRVFSATNGMYNPQEYCHRLLEERMTGKEVGYDTCRTTRCYQPEHAEVVVVRYLLEALGFISPNNYDEIIIEGTADAEHPLGLIDIRKLKDFIRNNSEIIERISQLKNKIRLTMYGHKICCDNCKEILGMIGLGDLPISVSEQTYRYERAKRAPLPEMVMESGVEQ